MRTIRRASPVWITLVSLVVGLPHAADAAKTPAVRKTDQGVLVEGDNRFALELYAKIRGENGNLFCSPYSVSTALAMTYGGARGETAAQMAKTLHFDLPQPRLHSAFAKVIKDLNEAGKKGDYELSVANALWAQEGYEFLEAYLELTKTHYGAGLETVDFKQATEAARKTINDWVEKQTKDKIKELIKPGVLDAVTELVLTNAIYFKGKWSLPFKEDATKDEPFTLAEGEKIDVPMMHQTEKFKYMEDDVFQMLELPYTGDRLAMTVLLPKKLDGLTGLEQQLTSKNMTRWLSKLRQQRVIVAIPKFQMTCEYRLDEVLAAMGMPDAFSGSADFSGMNGKDELAIGAVIHKAFVDVNEEGTEAAAATAVVMKRTAVLPMRKPPVFRADHPFVFMIRDLKTKSILFVGRVMNPEPSITRSAASVGTAPR